MNANMNNYSGPSIIRTPLVTAINSEVQIIEIVQINEMTKYMQW